MPLCVCVYVTLWVSEWVHVCVIEEQLSDFYNGSVEYN